jgi:hypothetical protein
MRYPIVRSNSKLSFVSQACTLWCSPNTQGRSRSSTASRLALIEFSGTSSRREGSRRSV